LHHRPETEHHQTAYVQVGMVLGVHGHHGQLRVRPMTDNPDRYLPGKVVYLQGQPYTVSETKHAGQNLLVKLEGVDSADEARLMLHLALEVPEAEVPEPPDGTYYHFQVLDLDVYDRSGAHLGRLAEVLQTGSNDVYVVIDGEQELLVPAIADVVVTVDLERHRMTVDLPEGLESRHVAPPAPARSKKRRRQRKRGPSPRSAASE
jgi:16S rRNA processing protein RimM